MMQKDETILLDTWIKYYSYLFGIDNLYILDNGSENEDTIKRLKFYNRLGCNINYNYKTKKNFEDKGFIIADIINQWDKKEHYDFVVIVDVDEYLILDQNYPTCNREKILNYFYSLIDNKQAILITKCYLNVPNEVGYFYPTYVPKSCFAKGTLGYLDHGYHIPLSKYSNSHYDSKLGYLHFHNRSFIEIIKKSKEKLRHHVNVENKESLRHYKGHGEHLIQYFFMTEKEYNDSFNDKGNIYLYEVINLFFLLSIDINSIFNSEYIEIIPSLNHGILTRYPSTDGKNYLFGYFNKYHYIQRNKDIRESNTDPITHFCQQGYKEYRPLNLMNLEFSVLKQNFKQYLSEPINLKNFNEKLKKLENFYYVQ